MIYAFYGLIFGLLIPYLARRFAKFMPATPAYALYRIIYPTKRTSKAKRRNNPKYQKLMRRYFMRSVGWGIISAALSYAAYIIFDLKQVCWLLAFIWILLLLYEIDERMFLLPDILTIPLLITGFAYSCFCLETNNTYLLSPAQLSALGAAAGYILPVIASALLVWKYPEAFGGGDIKLLSACGAWLGLTSVPQLILLSTVVFAIILLGKRQRSGAFGPAITIAALGLVFFNI